MNSEIPFNPLPLPDGLLVAQETSTPPPAPGPATARARKATRRKHTTRRRSKPARETAQAAQQSRWQRIKGRLHAKLGQIEPDTLKRILTAAGVAAGVIIAIMIAVKFTPIALVVLGLLGVAFLLRLWDRLRYFPHPF